MITFNYQDYPTLNQCYYCVYKNGHLFRQGIVDLVDKAELIKALEAFCEAENKEED